MIKAIYPGSFDPATWGHLDIIRRASKIVDYLYVGILNNSRKGAMFTAIERQEVLRAITADLTNVEVEVFEGLTVDYAKAKDANILIRGLRAVTDFEYEFQMALTNRTLAPEIETLFISTTAQYLYLSSSIVKEVASLGGNVDDMVPEKVKTLLLNKYMLKK